MKIQITNNEIRANNEMTIATLEAMKVDKEILKAVKEAFIHEKDFVVKTDSFEVVKDADGLYLDINESIFIDMSKVYCKHVPMIVVATQNLIQTIRMFRLDWFDKVDKKFQELQAVIKTKVKPQKEKEEKDPLEDEMVDLLFKDGVTKVTVKTKDGNERIIRRSLDDDTPEAKLKGWDEI